MKEHRNWTKENIPAMGMVGIPVIDIKGETVFEPAYVYSKRAEQEGAYDVKAVTRGKVTKSLSPDTHMQTSLPGFDGVLLQSIL